MKYPRARIRCSVGVILVIAAAAPLSRVRAGSVLLDLEDQSTTAAGALSSLSLSGGGVTATITRPNAGFGIVDLSGSSGTIAFGARSLAPADSTSPSPFVMNFSQLLSSISVTMGDFGGDTDSLRLRAFSGADGNGNVIGTDAMTLIAVDNTFSFKTLVVNGAGIRSAEVFGGADGLNSVIYDNFAATTGAINAVPLPSAIGVFPLAAATAAIAARRLKDVTVTR